VRGKREGEEIKKPEDPQCLKRVDAMLQGHIRWPTMITLLQTEGVVRNLLREWGSKQGSGERKSLSEAQRVGQSTGWVVCMQKTPEAEDVC